MRKWACNPRCWCFLLSLTISSLAADLELINNKTSAKRGETFRIDLNGKVPKLTSVRVRFNSSKIHFLDMESSGLATVIEDQRTLGDVINASGNVKGSLYMAFYSLRKPVEGRLATLSIHTP